MKFSDSLFLLLCAALPLAAEPLRVPAHSAYSDPDARGVRFREDQAASRWSGPENSIVWFGKFEKAGPVNCALAIQLPDQRTSRLKLTVNGKSREITVTGSGQPAEVPFGEFEIPSPGYQSFRLESANAPGEPNGDVSALLLDGPARENAHFNVKERRNAASVHLAYTLPRSTNISAFYVEATAVEEPVATFYMAAGWQRGYFGMQVNSPEERRIIFSVWDSGREAVDRNKVGAEDRVQLMAKGEDVHASDFGNEGTGGHSHLKYNWKTGSTQRFLLTSQPVDETHTVYTGYWFHPEEKAWKLISSMKAPKDGEWLRGLHSFSENFSGANGHLTRKALYGNQWVRDDKGNWTEMTEASFSHDSTGRRDRFDRFMGVEDGRFFLSHGGFTDGFTRFGELMTRPAGEKGPPDLSGLPEGVTL